MNALITVAGGLIGVYIVFALLTGHLVEIISTLFNQRGKTLYDGIVALLGKTERVGLDGQKKPLPDYVYAHPLISNLGSSSQRLPSYIAPRTFSLSLVEALRTVVTVKDEHGKPSFCDLGATPDDLLQDLVARVKALAPDDELGKSLRILLAGAQKDYDSALHALEVWFDTQMDRVAGVYRRWAAAWQGAVALLIVVAANADSIAIIKQLTQAAAVADALAAVGRTASVDSSVSSQLNSLLNSGLQLGWTAMPQGADVLGKCAGLFLTWLAVLLGAPFWFDLLKRVVPVRITGAKPAAVGSQSDVRDAQLAAREPA